MIKSAHSRNLLVRKQQMQFPTHLLLSSLSVIHCLVNVHVSCANGLIFAKLILLISPKFSLGKTESLLPKRKGKSHMGVVFSNGLARKRQECMVMLFQALSREIVLSRFVNLLVLLVSLPPGTFLWVCHLRLSSPHDSNDYEEGGRCYCGWLYSSHQTCF